MEATEAHCWADTAKGGEGGVPGGHGCARGRPPPGQKVPAGQAAQTPPLAASSSHPAGHVGPVGGRHADRLGAWTGAEGGQAAQALLPLAAL